MTYSSTATRSNTWGINSLNYSLNFETVLLKSQVANELPEIERVTSDLKLWHYFESLARLWREEFGFWWSRRLPHVIIEECEALGLPVLTERLID